MTPSSVVEAVETFADDVSRYLMPVVRFVGHKDGLFDSLARGYPALIHERDYSGEPADLVVFDSLPIDLLKAPGRLSAESAYIFCPGADVSLVPLLSDALSRHNALTLLAPSTETFLWHVKALLLIRDLSYSNGIIGFPDLLSIDRDHRRGMARLVHAVLDRRSCIVTVPSDDYRTALLDFLFGSMPDSIAPTYIDASRFAPELLADDRFNIVSGQTLPEARLSALIQTAEVENQRCPLMIVVTSDVHGKPGTSATEHMFELALSGWSDRRTDAHLLAYWAAGWQSHRSGEVVFYSASTIEQIRSRSGGDPCAARRLFMESSPDEPSPDTTLSELLDVYQRLSLDSILDEAERQIMSKLREQSPVVEAASHAAGIPTVTFHKRSRRLAGRSSLIELLASTRSS